MAMSVSSEQGNHHRLARGICHGYQDIVMKQPIREIIRSYSREEGESDRVHIVKQLGLFLHADVAAFFVELLSASDEGRSLIEILDILDIAHINEESSYFALGAQIRMLIETATDNLTKVYAAKAAPNFRDVPGML